RHGWAGAGLDWAMEVQARNLQSSHALYGGGSGGCALNDRTVNLTEDNFLGISSEVPSNCLTHEVAPAIPMRAAGEGVARIPSYVGEGLLLRRELAAPRVR